jgi:hypothetical protein
MRLGDNSRQLMLLATFSCSTLQTSDGAAAVLARWLGTFSGGLVMTVGAHNLLYSGNDQSATEFASRMQMENPSPKPGWNRPGTPTTTTPRAQWRLAPIPTTAGTG